MKYSEFRNKVLYLPIILSKDVVMFEKNRQVFRNQLKRWQDKGLIIKLRRGMYVLNADERKINPNRGVIANQLYSPSYVSLYYALSFYGLIPERVIDVTSVTTKKTVRFVNKLGVFVYQHIQPSAFRGFRAIKDESGFRFFIAEPEKAIVDFLYLNLSKIKITNKDIFDKSYRFQNTGNLNMRKIMELARLFKNKKLIKSAHLFCDFLKTKG